MTKDEQRRALALLAKLEGLDEQTMVEVKAFLAAVKAPSPATPDIACDRVANKHEEWVEMAIGQITVRASELDTFTADDLDLVPPAKGCLGAAFRQASQRGLIKKIDVCKSEKSSGHFLNVWELVEP